MIPLKLAIQNFLSYGPTTQVIDFTPYKLICLSGKNGHGKSAMLDAITWALWGQARKATSTSKPDLGLLRLGQTDMVVTLDFIFNNQGYRVRRMFSTKYGKPSAHVDFGTYNPKTGSYAPLTEKTIRKTQEKIEHTIGLDYESFINSSFLRQGQANEFSKKLPKERKDVLATILGLNKYEKAKKQTLEHIRTLSQEREKLAKINEHLLQELEQLPATKEKLHTLQLQLQAIATQEETVTLQKKELEATRTTLSKKQSDYILLKREREQIAHSKELDTTTFTNLVQAWKESHRKHLLLPDRKKIEQEKQQLLNQLSTLQTAYQKTLEKKEKLLAYKQKEHDLTMHLRTTHEQEIQEKKLTIERLSTHKKNYLHALAETESALAKHAQEYELSKKTVDELNKMSDPTLLISDTATLEKQFERQKMFYIKWLDEGKRATQELQNLSHKQQLTHDTENPSCPLCEQNLSLARKRFLSKKFENQHLFLTHRIARLKAVLATLKGILEKQKQAIEMSKKTDALLQTTTDLAQTIKTFEETALTLNKQIMQTEQQVTATQKEIIACEQKATTDLALHPAYIELQKQKRECEMFIHDNAQLPALLNDVQTKHTLIQTHMQQWESLSEELLIQKERKKKISEAAKNLRATLALEKKYTDQLHRYNELPKEEALFAQQQEIYLQATESIANQKNQLLQEKGKVTAELAKCEQQAAQHKQFEEQSKQLNQSIEEYQLIAQAFGKDGIQALLIEDALPEIENEANDLLSRLTDNQAHIFIESLRDLKKGGVRETLDINISDNNGIRPYEMFSGGEAFRIDFSLRIAISKLLARRAGTSLQTLIIDEGFGSQDEDGLSRIMDCLYKIQDDFEKIIIVSHLSAMKDQFPVHFYIEKGPHGSCTHIKEQG